MRLILPHLILFISVFYIGGNFVSGQDITPPERPFISYVTVDTLTGNTDIYWEESSSEDVLWYYLYYEIETVNGLEGVKLDSVPPGNSSYVHPGEAGNGSVIYSITAIDSSGNESLRTPGFHSTVFLQSDYDSCTNSITLSWNRYLGWGNNLSGYRIYHRKSDEGYGLPDGVEKNDSSLLIENIEENTNYVFYVEAVKNDTLVSSSNLATMYTYMPGHPESLELLNVNSVSPSATEIYFEFSDTSGIQSYRLLRSLDPTADFIAISDLTGLSDGVNTFIDTINTSSQRFYYKIGALNSCGQVFSESNKGTNIVLSGQNNGDSNELSWTAYEEWNTGVEEYQVYRIDEEGNSFLMGSTGPGNYEFDHDLRIIYGTEVEGSVSYRIAAKQSSSDIQSFSNIIQLDLNSRVTVPNAFTPNQDGRNDTFRPVFSVLPEKFLMVIYDRYGIIVYKTENPAEGWDGKINDGNMATEGVYAYHIQFTSFSGTAKELTGRVTVFYPD